jgi:hypothetical protein
VPVFRSQFIECVVQLQQTNVWIGRMRFNGRKTDSLKVAASLYGAFMPGLFDEDSPHGLGCRGKQMSVAIPELCPLGVHQSDIRLVD